MIYQMENDLPSSLRTLKVTFFIIPRRQMPQDVPGQARYRPTLFHESHLIKGWIRPRNCPKVVEEHEMVIVWVISVKLMRKQLIGKICEQGRINGKVE